MCYYHPIILIRTDHQELYATALTYDLYATALTYELRLTRRNKEQSKTKTLGTHLYKGDGTGSGEFIERAGSVGIDSTTALRSQCCAALVDP
jgi:hypothetical protein